jgi:hypothetical protein
MMMMMIMIGPDYIWGTLGEISKMGRGKGKKTEGKEKESTLHIYV